MKLLEVTWPPFPAKADRSPPKPHSPRRFHHIVIVIIAAVHIIPTVHTVATQIVLLLQIHLATISWF